VLSELFKQKANFSAVSRLPGLLKILNEDTRSNFRTFDYMKVALKLMTKKGDFIMLTLPGETKTIDNISYVIVDPVEAKRFLNENLN
jgi:anionic cell wall polymer biosynthesis LytR-Cps2A-Psr (LCP) family protein